MIANTLLNDGEPEPAHDVYIPQPAGPSGRKNVVRFLEAWYVACESSELGATRPLARVILDTPLVLFRGRDGRAGALLDRCPHRNVPLSIGRVQDGELHCRYHGWRFDCGGRLQGIPGLPVVDGVDVDKPGRRCQAFPVVERHGYVFVWMNPAAKPAIEPFDPKHDTWSGYHRIMFWSDAEATLHSTLENILDVPHTSVLHRGLFRSAEKKNDLTVVVRRRRDSIEAEFIGEPRPPGLFGRALSPSGGTVVHFDRFFLPSIAQIEYRLGDNHIVATTYCTPIHETRTRMFFIVAVKAHPLAYLLAPLAVLGGWGILRQDKWILKQQTRLVDQFGSEKFSSTPIDMIGPHIVHLMRKAQSGTLDDAIVRDETFHLRT